MSLRGRAIVEAVAIFMRLLRRHFIPPRNDKKNKFIKFIVFIILITFIGFFVWRPSPAAAGWFDDNFAYRNAIAISSHTASENNVYISATIDTSASGQFQGDCGDLRFTDYNGNVLNYYVVSGCTTASTVVHIFFDTMPAGAQTIYYYYGNPSASNGFSSADFATQAASYAVGSVGTQEKGGAPVAYWKFDEGTGTALQGATISGATWQTEDQCVAGKCLSFDGTNDVVTVANSVSGIQSVSFWVRPITTTEQFVDLNGSAYIQASSGIVSATGFTSPTIYIDGKVSSTIVANKWQHVSVTTASSLTGSAIKVGQISTNYGQGFFDDVKIYNYARSAAQVKTDFAGRGTSKGSSLSTKPLAPGTLSNGLTAYYKMEDVNDSSGNSVTLTNNGVTTFTAGKFGNASTYNGSSQYLSTATSISGVKTVSFWVNPASTTDNYLNLASGVYINSSTGTITATGTTSPTIYVNGVISSTIAASTWSFVTVTTDTAITANFFETGRANSSYAGNGSKLDEVRIYNRALSPKEVRDLYNWAPSPRVYLKMEEGSGTSANDDSGNGRTGTLQGNPIWAPGKYGKGVKLDGTGDFIQVSDF